MDIINPGASELAWTLLTAFGLIGAAVLFIFSTRTMLKSSSLGKTQKILLFICTIIFPIIAPALTIKLVPTEEEEAQK